MPRISIFAPGIRLGGGLVLLQDLISAIPRPKEFEAYLDARITGEVQLPDGLKVIWIKPGAVGRFKAELILSKRATIASTVLCLHGIPPLFAHRQTIVLSIQNRLLIDKLSYTELPPRLAIRLVILRGMLRLLHHRARMVLVQTSSMKTCAEQYFSLHKRTPPNIRVRPVLTLPAPVAKQTGAPKWDFIYPADGQAHKNHHQLVSAWCQLAKSRHFPSLALTLGEKDSALAANIAKIAQRRGLRITNLGHLPHAELVNHYGNSLALIFPSTTESFGLPLIEATAIDLPIVASERDFVRDVCEPVETFDPKSPVSIARAVTRYLGLSDAEKSFMAPSVFWKEMLQAGAHDDTPQKVIEQA